VNRPSVGDRLVCQHMYFPVQGQVSRWMQLTHEDHVHLFFRINLETGVEKSSPIVSSRRAKFCERTFYTFHAEAQAKSLVRTDFSQLVLAHQFDRLTAQQTCVSSLAAVEHHLAE